jgi:uncharacterized membrane protein
MTVESTGEIVVDAPVEACFESTVDFDRWPDWARDMESVKVLESSGTRRRVEFGVELVGKDYGATVDFDLAGGPGRVTLSLVESRKLATVDGFFAFTPTGGGGTVMAFTITANLVKPKAERIERLFARRIETMLTRDLRRHIERNNRRR